MPSINCTEQPLEIVRIEAYPLDAITIPRQFTHQRVIESSKVIVKGEPVKLSLREQSATSGCTKAEDRSGPYFNISLSWQTDDTSDEAISQLSPLETNPHHYIIYIYGGQRRLLYNEDGFASSFANTQTTDEETATVSLSYISRIPILHIK